MKMFILFFFIFSSFILNAQGEPCKDFLFKMTEALNKNKIDEIKTYMKGFIECKEEILGYDNKIVKSFDQMQYIITLENGNFLSKLKTGGYIILDSEFNLKKQIIVQDIGKFNNNIAITKNESKYGVIDNNGDIVFNCENEKIIHYQNNKINFFLIGNKDLFKEKTKIYNTNNYNIVLKKNKKFLALVFESIDVIKNVLDFNGKELFDRDINYIYYNELQELFYVIKSDQVGVANSNGEFIIPFKKFTTFNFKNDGWHEDKKNKLGTKNFIVLESSIYTTYGNLIDKNVKDVTEFQKNYIKIQKDNYTYLYDFYGNLIFKEKLKNIHYFDKESFSIVEDLNGCFYLDKKLKSITNKRYKKCHPFNKNNTAFVENYGNYKGKRFYESKIYGIINTKGEEIIPPLFLNIESLDNFYIVKGEKFECIDLLGKNISGKLYDDILSHNLNKELVSNREKYNSFKYSKNYNLVLFNGKYGIIDSNGIEIIPTMYDELSLPSEDLIVAKINGYYGYIDINNNQKTLFKYQDATVFNEGLAAVKLDNKYYYIDKDENILINKKYDNAGKFNFNISVTNYKYTEANIININGVKLFYVYILNPYEDISICANEKNKIGIIRKSEFSGYYVAFPFLYDSIEKISEKYFKVKVGNKFGVFDYYHNNIIPIQYDSLNYLNDDSINVTLDGVFFIIDIKGNCVKNCENIQSKNLQEKN